MSTAAGDAAVDVGQLYRELNFPSAAKFRQALAQRGLPARLADVARFTQPEGARQVLAARPTYDGRIVSTGPDKRWAADLISYVADPAKTAQKRYSVKRSSAPARYILVAQDIWSRKIWTAALTNVSEATDAMERILEQTGRKPAEMNVDMGVEFGQPFQDMLRRRGIALRQKDPKDKNAIATVDRAIATLKSALTRRVSQPNSGNWAEELQAATNGVNNSPHDHLDGATPNMAAEGDNASLQFDLMQDAAEGLVANDALLRGRQEKIEAQGAYRTLESADGPRQRGFKPRWSEAVHKVGSFKTPGVVVDGNGKETMTKHVLPVPAGSTAVAFSQYATRGSAQVDTRRRDALQRYVTRFVDQLRVYGPTQLSTASKRLRQAVPDFAQALRNQRATFHQFVQLFPESLKLEQGRVSAVPKAPSVQAATPSPNTIDAYVVPAAVPAARLEAY